MTHPLPSTITSLDTVFNAVSASFRALVHNVLRIVLCPRYINSDGLINIREYSFFRLNGENKKYIVLLVLMHSLQLFNLGLKPCFKLWFSGKCDPSYHPWKCTSIDPGNGTVEFEQGLAFSTSLSDVPLYPPYSSIDSRLESHHIAAATTTTNTTNNQKQQCWDPQRLWWPLVYILWENSLYKLITAQKRTEALRRVLTHVDLLTIDERWNDP